MGKSDDSITRRKNKKSLKKQENKKSSSSQVSSRVAAIIASKKRRQSGKRRLCQGMCFSLPTPENPFNEAKTEQSKKRKRDSKENKKLLDKNARRPKNKSLNNKDASENPQVDNNVTKSENANNGKLALVSISFMGPKIAIDVGTPSCQVIKWDKSDRSLKELGSDRKNTESPSKFLIMCLNSIQGALQNGDVLSSEEEKPLLANAWGLEFWNCYSTGKDVLEINGVDSTMEQIAWMASTAADTISMKEKEGLSFGGPFLLYLVPSQDKASKVRQVCKPLKVLGIHTVSLHSGAPIDHQINGLKSCEPEFLVSTPERLLELLSLKAVDISGVSLLVVDGLEDPFKGAYFDAVKSIRQFISGNLRTVIFCDCTTNTSISVVKKLLGGK